MTIPGKTLHIDIPVKLIVNDISNWKAKSQVVVFSVASLSFEGEEACQRVENALSPD
jgi:hypothetical protein